MNCLKVLSNSLIIMVQTKWYQNTDVELQIKAPPKSHIQPVLLGISDGSKRKVPVTTD